MSLAPKLQLESKVNTLNQKSRLGEITPNNDYYDHPTNQIENFAFACFGAVFAK
jgi:hypothetical protein